MITPYTDPDRFTDEEREIWLAGTCGWQTAYGLVTPRSRPGNVEYCEEPSEAGADFGFCTEHNLEYIETERDWESAGGR